MLIRSFAFGFLLLMAISSCTKDVVLAEPVYPPGERPAIQFSSDKPIPANSNVGGTVKFTIAGLDAYAGQFKFYINDAEAEVVALDNNSVTVRIPQTAITGNASIKVADKTYFGPLIKINGSIEIDPNFSTAGSQAVGTTYGIVPSPNGYYVYGTFSDFNNKASITVPIRGVVNINADGNYSDNQYLMSRVFDGTGVRSMIPLNGGRYFVAGGFNSIFYDESNDALDRRFDNINNMAVVYQEGLLDTTIVDIINSNPAENPNGDKDTVSTFNGGVTAGDVVKAFVDSDGKIVVVGNFYVYSSVFYPASTATSYYTDLIVTPVNVRMNQDGSFDSTYNYNPATKRGGDGATGNILDAAMLPGDDILLAGNFTAIHGVAARYLARIKASDGTVDASFNPGGVGPNGDVSSVKYNPATGKVLIAGPFTTYNGVAVNGVAMLNPDGSLDNNFQFKQITGGLVNFAQQLNFKNIIVVSGSFTHYNNQVRPGLMFLDASGNLIPEYNRFGLFSGALTGILEQADANTGLTSLFLTGRFSRFDNIEVGNFLKVNFLE
ncbi:DUF5008 domain-containing protein [Niabella terrae]